MAESKDMVNRKQLTGADQLKYELLDTIKAVSKIVTTMEDLKRELAHQGIGMLYKYKRGTQEIQGISFSKGEYRFKGSEIDRSLSYFKLSKSISERVQGWEQSHEPPLSLADKLKQVIKEQQERQPQTGLQSLPEVYYPEYETEGNLQGNALSGFNPSINITDDIDDEAILGRNRRRVRKARTNTR
jgi:hypothetical protein